MWMRQSASADRPSQWMLVAADMGPPFRGDDKQKLTRLLRRLHLEAAGETLGFELLGDQERELERLAAVQARIAVRVVAARKISLAHLARATDTLGHVLPRH